MTAKDVPDYSHPSGGLFADGWLSASGEEDAARSTRFANGREDSFDRRWRWSPAVCNVVAPKDVPVRPGWLPWTESSKIPAETVNTVKSCLSGLAIRQSGFAPSSDFIQ